MDLDIYGDIMTGEKLSSILLANMELVYWSVRSSVGGDGDVVLGMALGGLAASFTLLENMEI